MVDAQATDQATAQRAGQEKNSLTNLVNAVRESYKANRKYREQRVDALKQLTGDRYGEGGLGKSRPTPLLAMWTRVLMRNLVSRRPQVIINTPHDDLRPRAYKFELALNHLLDEIRFAETIEEVALDALFGVGMVKIAVEALHKVEVQGIYHDYGQPYAMSVDLDDAVWDTTARQFEECAFIGNYYELPKQYVAESGLYQNLDRFLGEGGGSRGALEAESRADELAHGQAPRFGGEFEEKVTLLDLYLPRTNEFMTLPADGSDYFLRPPKQWTGPEQGPYRVLGFGKVPSQINPLPPSHMILQLHDDANMLFNKLRHQAGRNKRGLHVDNTSAALAEEYRKCADGSVLQGRGDAKEWELGGPSQRNLAFYLMVKQEFDWFAGNLTSAGGLGKEADTLGQERIIKASSSENITDYQQRLELFTEAMVKDLGWHLWYDPMIEIPISKRVGESGIEIPGTFGPEDREGDFMEHNIQIVPYSMHNMTPGERLQAMQNYLQSVVFPMLPFIEQEGGQVDMALINETFAKYANMPELRHLVTFTEPQTTDKEGPVQGGGEGGAHRATQSPVTTRNYVRQNRPGGTQQGQAAAMMRTLMGSDDQDANLASLLETQG